MKELIEKREIAERRYVVMTNNMIEAQHKQHVAFQQLLSAQKAEATAGLTK